MREGSRRLCDGPLSISVGGGGARTLLQVSDGRTIRFWTDTSGLERAGEGVAVRLSAFGGFCEVSLEGEEARFEYGVADEGSTRCAIARDEWRDALAWVRGRPAPDEMDGGDAPARA